MSRIGLSPAKPVLKIVGSRSIGTPEPQPTRTDRHRTFGLQLRHLAHPSTYVDQDPMTCHRTFQDRQECITVIGITSGSYPARDNSGRRVLSAQQVVDAVGIAYAYLAPH
jgi:hypothetical protein